MTPLPSTSNMSVADDIIRELAGTPEPVLVDVLAHLRARKREVAFAWGVGIRGPAPTGHAPECTRAEEPIRYKDLDCETCGWAGCSCHGDHTGYGEIYCPVCGWEIE